MRGWKSTGTRIDPTGTRVDSANESRRGSPGKQTLTEALAPVQRKPDGSAPSAGDVHGAAARGTATPATSLPYADSLQAAFGRHDLSHVKAHIGGPAAEACEDMGARAFATGDHVAFASPPDLHTAAHEAAHVVQQARGVNLYGGVGAAGDEYERHADAVADRVVAGQSAEDLLGPVGGGVATAAVQKDDGKPPASAASTGTAGKDNGKPKIDLHGAPYQWVPGTFNLYVSTQWYKSASDYQEVEGGSLAPSRIRELLGVLREKGMLTWASPERIAMASQTVGFPVGHAEVVNISLGTTAFHALGLPPGTGVLVGMGGDGPQGMDIVVQVPGADGADGKQFEISPALKQQIVSAVEGFTKLKAKPEVVAGYLAKQGDQAAVNAGTAWIKWTRESPEALFGKDEYDKWAGAKKEGSEFQFDIGAGNQSFADLKPEEVQFIKDWLKRHGGQGSGGRPIAMTRSLLEALKKIDGLPEAWRDRVYAMTQGTPGDPSKGAGDGMITSDAVERMIQQAKFDWEREAAGFAPEKRTANGAPPTFDWPIPARIDQKNGLIISGEDVEFDLVIDWPTAYTAQAQSDYTWRPMRATVDWLFERPKAGGKGDDASRATSYIDWSRNGHQNHKFLLGKGEDSAIWTVHAFVHHNFFQPSHVTTQVEVKTEEQRLQDQRKATFQTMGQPEIKEKDHAFETQSDFDDIFNKHAYDHGLVFRGQLPEGYQSKTPEERKKSLEDEIKTNQGMLTYLQNEGTHPEAVDACKHYIAKLQDALKAMDEDVEAKRAPFDLKGFFLGRDNHVGDGPLDLYGTVKQDWGGVTVQIRDLSRRLEAENYTFTGHAGKFEKALELAFVDLCKKYPGGKVSILAEGLDEHGSQKTGKTVGFELDTGSAWKDTKEKVFDPAVNIAVNVAGAVAAVFVPEIAIPLLIAYNEIQNVDSFVDEWSSGTLTLTKGALHLAQLGMDIMPAIGQAPLFKSSKAAFYIFQAASFAGQAILMQQQVTEQIRGIRDTQIKDMAQLYAQYVDLEKTTQASDPKRSDMKAKLDKRAEEIRQTAIDTWTTAIAQFAIVAVPAHVAGMLHENIRTGKLGDLRSSGRFVDSPGAERPFYNEKTGQIVGDQKHMDMPTIDRLTREQNEHMRKLGGRLADELGVTADKVNLQAGDENRIWKDGDKVEVRYKPGTDPASALKGWEADARTAKIGKPGSHPEPTPTPHVTDVPSDHPTRPSDHETVSETAKIDPELAGGGSSQAKESTAAKVPGSDFKGGVKPGDKANTDAIMGEARGGFAEVANKVVAGADIKPAGGDAFVITLADGSSLTVRVETGPVAGEAVARTVVNNTKEGVLKVGSPPTDVQVRGRYVIQLNETMDPVNTRRALAHEVGEIIGERKLSADKKGVGPDLLKPGVAPEPGAELSPHDQGRVAEIKVLAEKVKAGDAAAKREMLALVEELGLRDGEPGAAQRRELVAKLLKDDPGAATALDTLARPRAELPPDLRSQLDGVKTARDADLARAKTEADQKAASAGHVTPDANPAPGKVVSLEQAHQMAIQAATERARVSAETLADLRAQASSLPEGEYPKVKDVQAGGGAALAARDKAALLIDQRGRWQADASDRIAQTANQLRGLKDAGLGDPFQFAQPDERVPMSAIRYWEDNIAAQGKCIDGKVSSIAIDERGRTILTIEPSDGKPIKVEVEGNLAMATGFPTERMPGTPRTGITPEKAVDQVKAALQAIISDPDPAVPANRKVNARAVLAEIKDTTGLETTPGQRAKDLAKVRAALKTHGLEDTVAPGGDLDKMLIAGDKWNNLTKGHPKEVVLGDMANLESLDATVTNKWVVGGVSGTGISAVEIILAKNPEAHVTMVGDKAPPGLVDNDQFMAVVRAHCDAPSAAQIEKITGVKVTPGDGRFSVIFDVNLDNPPTRDAKGIHAADPSYIPPGYDASTNPLAGAQGYVAAMGRPEGLPPVASALFDSMQAKGGTMTMEPSYVDGRYVGYRLHAIDKPPTPGAAGNVVKEIDVTGAASRFPPWDMLEVGGGNHGAANADQVKAAKEKFRAASSFDAPSESGNFDGGFVASAQQAADYAAAKKAGKL